jgi:hypothetical protein
MELVFCLTSDCDVKVYNSNNLPFYVKGRGHDYRKTKYRGIYTLSFGARKAPLLKCINGNLIKGSLEIFVYDDNGFVKSVKAMDLC